jgi:hypothetical protein
MRPAPGVAAHQVSKADTGSHTVVIGDEQHAEMDVARVSMVAERKRVVRIRPRQFRGETVSGAPDVYFRGVVQSGHTLNPFLSAIAAFGRGS